MPPIAQAHRRIRTLLAAQGGVLSDQGELNAALNSEIDEHSRTAIRAAEEEPSDCLLQADLGLLGLENLRDDLQGNDQLVVERAILAITSLASCVSRLAGLPLRDEGTVTGLATACIRDSVRYCQPAA